MIHVFVVGSTNKEWNLRMKQWNQRASLSLTCMLAIAFIEQSSSISRSGHFVLFFFCFNELIFLHIMDEISGWDVRLLTVWWWKVFFFMQWTKCERIEKKNLSRRAIIENTLPSWLIIISCRVLLKCKRNVRIVNEAFVLRSKFPLYR